MAAYIDLLTDDETGDLSIIGGDFNLTSTTAQSLRQRIEARFSTWKGEWVYDTTFGTPYKQRLLIAGVTQGQADAEFIAQVNLEEDVTAIRNVTSSYDPSTRSYVLSRIEAYVDERLIDLSLTYPTIKQYSYPEPLQLDEDFSICGDNQEDEFISGSNALHELIHFELPISGTATWWNLWK